MAILGKIMIWAAFIGLVVLVLHQWRVNDGLQIENHHLNAMIREMLDEAEKAAKK